jgi:hypothetical protein
MSGSETLTWTQTLDAFGIDWDAPMVVAGTDATTLAVACTRRGASGIAAEGIDWYLLANDAPDGAPESWRDLPAGIAGTVIIRRAWPSRSALGPAVRAAAALVAEGGRLFVADLDVDRLLTGTPVHYPYQLRFTLDPAAAETLRTRTTPAADIALDVGRTGMLPVTSVVVEEERGTFDGAAGYWTAVRDGAWPSLSETPADEREILLENLAVALERIAPVGEIVERRPWFVATGARA